MRDDTIFRKSGIIQYLHRSKRLLIPQRDDYVIFISRCNFFFYKISNLPKFTPERSRKYLMFPWYSCCSPMGLTLML
jgi:hypothetical protein